MRLKILQANQTFSQGRFLDMKYFLFFAFTGLKMGPWYIQYHSILTDPYSRSRARV